MSHVKRILVPTDFSDDARAAVRYATGLAKDLSAEIVLVHVIAAPGYLMPVEYSMPLPEIVELRQYATREMEALLEEVQPVARARSIVAKGRAAAEIVKLAKAQRADLIVIGSRGLGRVRSALFGSTVSKVLHEAECPVIVHRADAARLRGARKRRAVKARHRKLRAVGAA